MNITPKEIEKYGDHYTEDGFWSKIKAIAGKSTTARTVIEKAVALYYVLTSNQVELKDKAVIVGALGYLILPVDLIPDVILAIGLTDDLAALTIAYNMVKKNINADIQRQVDQKMANLFGGTHTA